jgi:hypothetical protein
MKKYTFFCLSFFCLMFALRADQEENLASDASDSVVAAAEQNYPESFVDQDNGEWAEIKRDFKRNKLLKPFFKVIKYFKKRSDQRDAKLDSIILHQKASEKHRDRQDKKIKYLQQSILRQNKYEGG